MTAKPDKASIEALAEILESGNYNDIFHGKAREQAGGIIRDAAKTMGAIAGTPEEKMPALFRMGQAYINLLLCRPVITHNVKEEIVHKCNKLLAIFKDTEFEADAHLLKASYHKIMLTLCMHECENDPRIILFNTNKQAIRSHHVNGLNHSTRALALRPGDPEALETQAEIGVLAKRALELTVSAETTAAMHRANELKKSRAGNKHHERIRPPRSQMLLGQRP